MSYLNGDIETSKKLQLELKPLIDSLFIEVNPIPVKTALNLMGLNAGKLRLPLTDMEDKNIEILKKELLDRGIKLC